MDKNHANIGVDRAEGTSQRCGNPSAIIFSADDKFVPKANAPKTLLPGQLRKLLVKEGFLDGDTDQAESVLNRISYQHLSEYFALIKKIDAKEYRSFKMLHRVAMFDRKLQSLLMEGIGIFELQFRAQYSYSLAAEKGSFAHRDPSNFKSQKYYSNTLVSYEKEINRQVKKKNKTVIDALSKYGDLPLWLAVEIMSFGTLSMLYNNTRSKRVRRAVSDSFGAKYDDFTSWTRSLSALRNQCAHFGSVCPHTLISRPKRIEGLSYKDNGHFYYAILIIEYLLGHDQLYTDDPSITYSLSFAKSVVNLFNEYLRILDIVGVPKNWTSLLFNETITGAEWEHKGKVGGRIDDVYIQVTESDGTKKKINL